MAELPVSEETLRAICNGMSEKAKRLYLGRLANDYGYGGISLVASLAVVSRGMVSRGVKEVRSGAEYKPNDRDRCIGGGRKSAEEQHRIIMAKKAESEPVSETDADLVKLVGDIVDQYTYGDPVQGRIYCNITVSETSAEVERRSGQRYGNTTIRKILKKLNYKCLKNQKYNQIGNQHPRRNDQFLNIQARIEEYRLQGNPVISIDTKAKEKIGNFISSGREWRKSGDPRRVLDHDFAFRFHEIYPSGNEYIPEDMMDYPAIAIPYGVYCLGTNEAYVTVGITSDTSEFAKDSIENWWNECGKHSYPNAEKILILADGGGSNRSRGNLFKIALQQLADTTGLEIEVCHYPPGCSKYDPIEHKLWPHVSHAWSGKPLNSLEALVAYIRGTKTKTGLNVKCTVNSKVYLTEKKKAKALEQGQAVEGIINAGILGDDLCITHGAFEDNAMRSWNYIIKPHPGSMRWKSYRKPDVVLRS